MYLLARTNNKNIYEELKLVEHFTTTNCLNCISGYYLNVFNASIESILELEDRNWFMLFSHNFLLLCLIYYDW